MDEEEFVANEFRILQTNQKYFKKNNASRVHYEVGKK
jgi:hypothetical protein